MVLRVKAIHERTGGVDDRRRMARELRGEGHAVGRWQARSLMQEAGIEVRRKRRFKLTTDSRHRLLIVCGHCHYAYYGKKVSKRAANGGQQYAYYRCIGTDAYRFGGERLCDNKQVRTSQLDDLVWQQVVALLQHPERLRQEYEQRLQRLERDHRSNADTAALEKHKRHLQQGKSRLIDGYTEGLIDKADFDPKMAQLKIKFEQVQAQIEASQRQHAGQVELFLVINRLEEFAAAVSDRLTTLEFSKRPANYRIVPFGVMSSNVRLCGRSAATASGVLAAGRCSKRSLR